MTRIDEIKSILLKRKEVSVNQLCSHFKVSAVSIRKDLTRLEDEGFLRRVYGGAVLSEQAPVPKSHDLDFDNPILYQLAEHACSCICDNDIIFLGSGRTCCILARLLRKFSNLSVVTNNITALDDLLSSGARIYLVGGEVTSTDGITLFASPDDPSKFTRNIRVNKAFTSISGIDLHNGLTVNSIISTYIYRYLPEFANKWYIMASSDKFDKLSMYSAAKLDDIDCVITDSCPPEYIKLFKSNHIELKVVGEDNDNISDEIEDPNKNDAP